MPDAEPALDLSELLELYKQDALQIIERLENGVERWGEVVSGGPARSEIRRLSHQLRGSGRTYGYQAVSRLSKAMERIMEKIDKNKISTDSRVRQSLERKIRSLRQAFGAAR